MYSISYKHATSFCANSACQLFNIRFTFIVLTSSLGVNSSTNEEEDDTNNERRRVFHHLDEEACINDVMIYPFFSRCVIVRSYNYRTHVVSMVVIQERTRFCLSVHECEIKFVRTLAFQLFVTCKESKCTVIHFLYGRGRFKIASCT